MKVKADSDSAKKNLEKELLAIGTFMDAVSKEHKISVAKIISLLGKEESKIVIPTYIFRDRRLGVLEAITKYLKEECSLTFRDISDLLGKNSKVIWSSYRNASKKKSNRFLISEPNVWLPVSILNDLRLGSLESISKYLKEEHNLRFSEIGSLLNRNDRTVWTSYNKALKKSKK